METAKFLLIRHAESAFNLASRKAKNSEKEVTSFAEESRKVKFDRSLIDCGLTEEGIQQCKQVAPTLHQYNINLVVTSPLRRAIETTHYLFKDHPNQPKVVVTPLVREMVSSSCDIGGDLLNTMKDFPHFDYSDILTSDFIKIYPNLWSLEHLWNKEHSQIILNEIQENLEPEDYNSKGPALFLEYMSRFPINTVENLKDTMSRVNQVKSPLKKKYRGATIVTHSRFLQTISANQFDDEAQPIDGLWWSNCQLRKLEL